MGEVVHKGKGYPGEHEAIVSKGLWERVQAVLSENTRARQTKARTKLISPLQGVVRCGHCDGAMGLTYTHKGPRRYTYYHCAKDAKRAVSRCRLERVPAGDIERVVLEQLSAVFRTPTLMSRTYFAAKGMEETGRERLLTQKTQLEDDFLKVRERALEADPVAEREVAEAFQSVETFWEDLFPLERNRLIRLLVEKVELRETGIDMELKTQGLSSLIIELSGLASEARETEQRPMTPQPILSLTGTGNLQIHIPMHIRRMRGRKMIFAPRALDGEVPEGPSAVQAAVVQALGRASSWVEAIESGEFHSISDLARNLDVDNSYVVRILKLTTLAPGHHRSDPPRRGTVGPVAGQTDPHLPHGLGAAASPVRVHPGLSPTPPSRAVRGRDPILEQDVRHTASCTMSAQLGTPPGPGPDISKQGRPSLFLEPLAPKANLEAIASILAVGVLRRRARKGGFPRDIRRKAKNPPPSRCTA